MTFWSWIFLFTLFFTLVPVAWLIAHAVGMEKASWGRAVLFSLLESAAAFGAMWLMPFGFFVLEAVAALFAVLFISPLVFRLLMTSESARALLGALLLTAVGIGGAVLVILI